MQIPQEYEVLQREKIGDIQSEGWLLRHKKSGARVLLLANQDENKVFHITFRTPPSDSTGAVSYTHLDVYKRQEYQTPSVPRKRGRIRRKIPRNTSSP